MRLMLRLDDAGLCGVTESTTTTTTTTIRIPRVFKRVNRKLPRIVSILHKSPEIFVICRRPVNICTCLKLAISRVMTVRRGFSAKVSGISSHSSLVIFIGSSKHSAPRLKEKGTKFRVYVERGDPSATFHTALFSSRSILQK